MDVGFEPFGLNTAIGSAPHTDAAYIAGLIMELFPELPFWPQLPRRSFLENMYVQFTEGLPGVVIDEANQKIRFETARVFGEAESFYEHYLAEDTEHFAISEEYAAGLHAWLALVAAGAAAQYLKGHVTGPVSFGLTVTDENKKAALYDDTIADVIVKGLALKAKWQEEQFKKVRPDLGTIIFVDEPYLTSFGSAFVSLQREQVVGRLREVFESITGLKGVHCCGKTDWTLLTEAGADIISFDAYAHAESVALYPAEISSFLERGGILAWGVVPTDLADPRRLLTDEAAFYVQRLNEGIDLVAAQGVDRDKLVAQSLVTPNCGAGSLAPEIGERVFALTKEVSEAFRG